MPLKRRDRGKLIDWNEARQRMSRAESAMEEAVHPTAERARAILDERALKLSRVVQEPENAGALVEALIFELGKERYALETAYILEVFPLTDFTPVPGVPPFLIGVTHYRGEILALIDLRKLFGIEVRGMTDLSRILVLGGERARCGLLVDQAQEIILLKPEAILPQPAGPAGRETQGLRGVTREALMVLDGEALLNDARLVVRHDGEADLDRINSGGKDE